MGSKIFGHLCTVCVYTCVCVLAFCQHTHTQHTHIYNRANANCKHKANANCHDTHSGSRSLGHTFTCETWYSLLRITMIVLPQDTDSYHLILSSAHGVPVCWFTGTIWLHSMAAKCFALLLSVFVHVNTPDSSLILLVVWYNSSSHVPGHVIETGMTRGFPCIGCITSCIHFMFFVVRGGRLGRMHYCLKDLSALLKICSYVHTHQYTACILPVYWWKENKIKTHGSVSCGPRSRRVTPVSILTGRKKTQFSHLRSSVLP